MRSFKSWSPSTAAYSLSRKSLKIQSLSCRPSIVGGGTPPASSSNDPPSFFCRLSRQPGRTRGADSGLLARLPEGNRTADSPAVALEQRGSIALLARCQYENHQHRHSLLQ